jgi:AcrR family transcriptional regulator
MARKRPYHHGNLKPALIAAAVERIAEVGPAAFTLREVARRAGISHSAPYRHFRDKGELLAAVATQGFERLAMALDVSDTHLGRARQRRPGPHWHACRRVASPTSNSALRSPEHLQVMFDWPLEPTGYPELKAASARAFGILLNLVQEAQRHGDLPEGDSLLLARIAWSMVHGVAKPAIGSRLPYMSERGVLEFAGLAIDTLYRGMAHGVGSTCGSTVGGEVIRELRRRKPRG